MEGRRSRAAERKCERLLVARSWEEGGRKAKECGGNGETEWNGELQPFNYSAHRQQSPRFQETITVCSPEGKAQLASVISPFLSPHKLQFGIFKCIYVAVAQANKVCECCNAC